MVLRSVDRRAVLASCLRGGLSAFALHGAYALHAAGPGERRHVAETPAFASDPFTLGVAAGEPEPDGFVIWTRLAPRPLEAHGGMPPLPVRVGWEVAADEGFRTVLRRGEAIAHPELAHAVHVEVAGLLPQRWYFYRFTAGSAQSAVGRAQTLPPAGAPLDRLRFAVAGCQHYEQGLFTAWRDIADQAPDFVFHYGDYIYEGGDTGGQPHMVFGEAMAPVRRHGTPELLSLDDYRQRYALYKTDADLQAAHAASAFFVTFDDHEVDNNWAGLSDQDGTPPEVFALRRAAAFQAFYEHMPLRPRSLPHGGNMRIDRAARFGDLLDAWFLDTRQFRSDQPCGADRSPLCPEAWDSGRTMLGAAQERSLFDGLATGTARWNMLAQQVMFMNLDVRRDPLEAGPQYPMDSWAGYLAARERLLAHIDNLGLHNVAIVTGDAHQHFVGDVCRQATPDRPTASEFLATSISSGGDGTGDLPYTPLWLRNNAHLKLMNNKRGYMLCSVDRQVWRSDMRAIDTVERPGATASNLATFVLEQGRRGIQPG